MADQNPAMPSTDASDGELARRSFLRFVIGAGAAVMAAITIVPGVGLLLAPALSRGQRKRARVVFTNPADVSAASFVPARYEGQPETAPGIFVEMRQGRPFVISARCSHASCPVNWVPSQRQFVCPCHGGRYDAGGRNISGPPPRPLDRLDAYAAGGQIYVEVPEA